MITIDITNDEVALEYALKQGGYSKDAMKHVISAKLLDYMYHGKHVSHFVVQFDKTIQVEKTIIQK